MLTNALVLGSLSAMGLVFMFRKLPPRAQQFLLDHALLTEIVTFLITYTTLGGSLTALFAGSIVSAVQSMLFHIRSNPKKYEGLMLASGWMMQQGGSFLSQVNSWLITTLKAPKQVTQLAA